MKTKGLRLFQVQVETSPTQSSLSLFLTQVQAWKVHAKNEKPSRSSQEEKRKRSPEDKTARLEIRYFKALLKQCEREERLAEKTWKLDRDRRDCKDYVA